VFDVNVKMLTPKSRIGSDKHDYGIYPCGSTTTPVATSRLLTKEYHREKIRVCTIGQY
jgi:hypothetical protein